ncbi:hypothetical protein H8959_000691 [Pygathrix nigripes]
MDLGRLSMSHVKGKPYFVANCCRRCRHCFVSEIIPKKPAEEGNDSKGVPEASGPQNDGKQLCPPGKANTSEKINKRSGPKRGKHVWTHRLRERKQPVIYEEISDPEEDDE